MKLQQRDGLGDDAETGSMMSSTFSLGDPLETASTQSVTGDAETDSSPQVVENMQNAVIADPAPSSDPATTPSAPSVAPSESMQDENPKDLSKQCLFCNHLSEDTTHNEMHMSKQHGMFIPERDFLVDRDGLLGFLYEKIHDDHVCLYCGQMKHTASGVQTHMRDRGHCMIAYDTETAMLEIGDFYDFRATYSDDEEDEQDGGVKLGGARPTKVTVNNENGDDEEVIDGEDDGWESDASSLSSVPTDEITAMPIDDYSHRYKVLDRHRHHSHNDPRPHRNLDGFHSHAHSTPHAVYHDDYELHLPSGRTAGHRSLNKYFRQNLRSHPSPAERASQAMIVGRHDSDEEMEDAQPRGHDRGRQLVSRANGGLGMVGVSDLKKREVRTVEKKAIKQAQRAQAKYQWGNNKQSNFQKHFRVCCARLHGTRALLTVPTGSSPAVDTPLPASSCRTGAFPYLCPLSIDDDELQLSHGEAHIEDIRFLSRWMRVTQRSRIRDNRCFSSQESPIARTVCHFPHRQKL